MPPEQKAALGIREGGLRLSIGVEDIEDILADLAQALAVLQDRPITLGRELTKQFEDIATMPAADVPAWLAADPHRSKGEFALLLHPQAVQSDGLGEAHRVLALLLAELPTKTAVKLAADITGAPRNALYDTALGWKRDAEQGDD
jgi:16S rRNA (cytidine1402-2'-O)-methyltransferase